MATLDDILIDIATALHQADYARLDALSAKLETVSIPTDPAALHCAAQQARRNEALLQATAQGLRAAHRRLAALRDGPTLTTYDGTGRKQKHPPATARTCRL